MKFVVLFEDDPAAGADVRRKHMAEHLAFLEAERGHGTGGWTVAESRWEGPRRPLDR